MNRSALCILMTGIAGASTHAFADVRVSDTASALFDNSGGRSLDDDATFSGGNWWMCECRRRRNTVEITSGNAGRYIQTCGIRPGRR